MQQDNKTNHFDLIIIGAGPAGLAAAIYAGRKKLKTLIISMNVGGQAALTHQVENYPGVETLAGFELLNKFKKQAESFGAEFAFAEAEKIIKAKDHFQIKTKQGDYFGRVIILAFGLKPKKLKVPGESELIGRGVTYCATCDGPLYKNKIAAVVGSGNAALESAEYLASLAKKVYLIHLSPKFKGDPYLLERIGEIKNLELVCCQAVKEIRGEKKIEAIVLENVDGGGNKKELKIDGLFIEIGYEPKSDWLKGFVDLNERGEIIISRDNAASLAGIFAAGDCTDIKYKQIVIAAGEGAKAALAAYGYIKN